MERVWLIEDPDEKPRIRIRDRGALSDEKSPAVAYSLSLLLWGAGQFHADLVVKGLAFFFLMLLVAGGAVIAVLHHEPLLSLLRSMGIARSDAFLLGEFLLLAVLVFWAYNAADAYHLAAQERSRPFTGVKNRIFPLLCSLLFPGWGQYLNGQPVKGGVYASLSMIELFALLSAFLTLAAWPFLEPSGSRDIIEEVFTTAVLVALPMPFIWLFGCYDALKVSLDDYLKEPLFERMKAMNNRRRTQGWVRGVFPRIGNIFALTLILIVFVAAAYRAFPEGYYLSLLDQIRRDLQHRGMTIVPEIIRTMYARIPHP
jgi:TM2 domain-containing membrane protein YozV